MFALQLCLTSTHNVDNSFVTNSETNHLNSVCKTTSASTSSKTLPKFLLSIQSTSFIKKSFKYIHYLHITIAYSQLSFNIDFVM